MFNINSPYYFSIGTEMLLKNIYYYSNINEIFTLTPLVNILEPINGYFNYFV